MRKLVIKFVALSLFELFILIPFAYLIAAWAISIFTKAEPDLDENTPKWGGWFGTWDNPPQGDRNWIEDDCYFPKVITGWKGYLNRVGWLLRNNCYGFSRDVGVKYSKNIVVSCAGDYPLSDKKRQPGSYLAEARDTSNGQLVAFEYYLVKPYKLLWKWDKCIRIRFGWKIMSRKFKEYGFAPMVNTANPIKKYGR